MGQIDKNIPIPLYYQLKEILLNDIKTRVYAPGEAIPTEMELTQRYDVSRTTVRQAIASLVSEGWLKRYKGVGTFVTEPNLPLSGALDVATIIKDSGYYLTTKLVGFARQPAPAIAAEMLQIAPGSQVYVMERVRLGNRRRCSYAKSYIPAALFPRMEAEKETVAEGLNSYCDRNGYPVTTISQKLSVVRADEESARILDIPVQTPILLMTNLAATDTGEPVHYSLSAIYSDDLTITNVGHRTPTV